MLSESDEIAYECGARQKYPILFDEAVTLHSGRWYVDLQFKFSKGQLISKCLFEKIVWTKIPTKNLIDSARTYFRAESIKFFVGILVQTIFSKRHFEIN